MTLWYVETALRDSDEWRCMYSTESEEMARLAASQCGHYWRGRNLRVRVRSEEIA